MKFYPLSISALWKNLLFLFLYHRSTLFSFQGTILLKRIFDFCLSALHHVSHTFCCRSVHSAFCAPHAALRACVSHALCTIAIFCFAKNAGLAWIFVPFQTRCIHSAAAVCTPLFVLLMQRFASACRTLRAQSQFFASQKTLVWLGFLSLSKPTAYILLPQCALRFLCSSCGASRPRVARSVHSRNFLLRKKLLWWR